jgi:hypothetical protein
LLARDYGSNRHNRFDGALNFDSFRAAMTTKAPGNQLFLVDACRTPDAIMRAVQESSAKGRNLLTADQYREGGAAMQSVHLATAPFSDAYGQKQGTGIYTEAIIQALNGGGAQANLRWAVGTDGLGMALSAYTPRLAAKFKLEQDPERLVGRSFTIHEPAKPIQIPVYVDCAPKEVWEQSIHFEASVGGAVTAAHRHDPAVDAAPEAWSLTVPLREHLVSARFDPGAPFADVVDEVLTVAPPETALSLNVGARQP